MHNNKKHNFTKRIAIFQQFFLFFRALNYLSQRWSNIMWIAHIKIPLRTPNSMKRLLIFFDPLPLIMNKAVIFQIFKDITCAFLNKWCNNGFERMFSYTYSIVLFKCQAIILKSSDIKHMRKLLAFLCNQLRYFYSRTNTFIYILQHFFVWTRFLFLKI